MKELLSKRLEDIDVSDIQRLLDTEVEENISLEYKGPIPVENGQLEPWQDGSNRIWSSSRDRVLSEVIAMANAVGGAVLLGIEETKDDPPRAASTFPLRDCIGLANRFHDMAWSCIDPRLPNIEIKGIPTGDDGAGVVLFRVQPSPRRPHGLTTTRQAYVRRGTSAEKMYISEIQDMTLSAKSTIERLEQRLEERRLAPKAKIDNCALNGRRTLALRISIVSTYLSTIVDHVYRKDELFPELREFGASMGETTVQLSPPGSVQSISRVPIRPRLRGGFRESSRDDLVLSQAVYGDGLIEFLFYLTSKNCENYMDLSAALNLLSNALVTADALRQAANSPGAEMVLDLEIAGAMSTPILACYGISRHADDVEQGKFESNPVRVPQYPVLNTQSFGGLVQRVMNDLREAAGLEAVDSFDVDFG